MRGWKWAEDLRVQICIIVALIFVIWMVLPAAILLSDRRLVELGLKAKK